MKKQIRVGLILTLLCLSSGAVAQNTRREALIDSIVNLSLMQLNRVDMMSLAETMIAENAAQDPVTAEAIIYATNVKSMRPLLLESYAQFTEDQLEEICRFMSSEACRRISSDEVSEMVGMLLGVGMVGYIAWMTEGRPWNPDVPSLNDKEYEALADKYIEQTNHMSLFESIMKPLVGSLGEELDPSTIQLLTSMMNHIKKNYPQYYKWALVDYVSKEQLQEVVDFYNQPYMLKVQQDAAFLATSMIDQIMKDPEAFKKLITEQFGSLTSATDTSAVVKEYLKLLPQMPFVGEKFEPILPVKTLAMKKKSTYTGQTRDGLAHGKGILTDKKGVRYSGDFKAGKRHGVITTHYTNGDTITQVWADDKVMKEQNTNIKMPVSLYAEQAMGYGFRYSEGDREEGLFIDDNLEGYGVKSMADGETTETGWFESGILIKGRTTTGNLSRGLIEFEGEQSQSLSYGNLKTGTLTVKTKKDERVTTMKGNFINNYQLHGMGSFESDGKESYQYEKGSFAYGKLYGEGHRTCKWKESNAMEVYDGEFFAGEYQGKGVKKHTRTNNENKLTYTQITDGYFYNGSVNGGMEYEETMTNIYHIAGRRWTFTRMGFDIEYGGYHRLAEEINTPDSLVIRIKGTAVNDKLEGEAEVTLSNGDYYKGTFEKGELVKGTARVMNSDKSVYEGEIKYGIRSGKGKLTFPNGTYEEGVFSNGICVKGVERNKRGVKLSEFMRTIEFH